MGKLIIQLKKCKHYQMQFPELIKQEEDEIGLQSSTNQEDYLLCKEDLDSQTIECTQLKRILCALLKSSDQYGLSKTTKFLAWQYCIRFLTKSNKFLWSDPQLLMISCLRLAVKFNQNSQLSTTYTTECCVLQSQGKYSHQNFIEFELTLLSALQFRLKIQSPYDILEENSRYLNLQAIQKTLIETAMDYMLSLLEYCELSAEEIFAICLGAICQQRKINKMKIFHHLQSLSRRHPNIEENAKKIRENIFNMDQEILESPSQNH